MIRKMETSLAQKAISLALQGKWDDAIKVNREILEVNSQDSEALNRLARAYSEVGEIGKARQTAQKVLKIDPVNTIALRCLDKWKVSGKIKKDTNQTVLADAFLEESGKTRLIELLNIGDKKLFVNLDAGEETKLVPFAHRVSVMTMDGRYVGRLPDDLASRLKSLMKSGNKYQVLIKSVKAGQVTVFIREMEKGATVRDVASFPPEKIDYVSFTPPELVHQDQPIAVGEDLEEAEGTI